MNTIVAFFTITAAMALTYAQLWLWAFAAVPWARRQPVNGDSTLIHVLIAVLSAA